MDRSPPKRSWFTWLFIFTKLSKAMKVLKAFKFLKPLLSVGSMLLSVFAYSFMLGPWFSIGFVLMLFIHEMGHVLAARIRGIPVSAPLFIPFLGAAIFMAKPEDRDTEAFVGYGGPLLGTIAAVAIFPIYFLLPEESPSAHLVLAVSNIALFLNLFNLVPVSPLDGGRVLQAVGTWFKHLGIAILVAFTLLLREPGFLLIWIIVIMEFRIPIRFRAVLMQVCLLGMTSLMFWGFGKQPWFINLLDIMLAGLFTLSISFAAQDPEFKDTYVADDRPILSSQDRYKWLALYAALAIILIALMSVQIPLLAEHAQRIPNSPILAQ